MTNIEIPESATSIDYGVFYECQKLEQITLPKGITKIPASMFGKCYNLKDIEIPFIWEGITTSVGSPV